MVFVEKNIAVIMPIFKIYEISIVILNLKTKSSIFYEFSESLNAKY